MYLISKRIFDLFFSGIFSIVFFPIIFLFGLWVVLDSPGPMFIFQERMGKNQKPFKLIKIRSMKVNSAQSGLLTIGNHDQRITKIGYFLRKYKLDELPQLWNVFVGQMSIVGPRPEVKKYVDLYTEDQKKVFSFRPGITDVSSIFYSKESEILAQQADPETHYKEVILPHKLQLSLNYLSKANFWTDLGIIIKTLQLFYKR
jgi:lipopolysaccharide/colanic/teichoic acid biosynthesis glycosyltransferase